MIAVGEALFVFLDELRNVVGRVGYGIRSIRKQHHRPGGVGHRFVDQLLLGISQAHPARCAAGRGINIVDRDLSHNATDDVPRGECILEVGHVAVAENANPVADIVGVDVETTRLLRR